MSARGFLRLARVIGPHPVTFARTLVFLAQRRLRGRHLGELYRTPLRDETVELRLPAVGLLREEELPAELVVRSSA